MPFAVLIFLFALILRLIPVIALREMGIGLDDMHQYGMLARSILAGEGYRWYAQDDLQLVLAYFQTINFQLPADYDPRGILTSFRPPLYPAFLSLVYALTGVDADRFFTARLVQTVLNALLAPLTYWLTLRLFPQQPKVAQIAAVILAIYPMMVLYSLSLATENLFFVLVVAAMLVLLRASQSTQPRDYLFAGILFGLAALTRSVISASVALLALWVWFALKNRRGALLLMLAFLVTISPWIIRNSLLHGKFSGIESALGYSLYVGYHPSGEGIFEYGISLDLMRYLDDAERDAVGRQAFTQFIQADPARVPYLWLNRFIHFFGLERRALTYFYVNNFFGPIPAPLLWILSIGVLLPFVLVAVFTALGLALVKWNRVSGFIPILMLAYTAPHIALLAEDRFHLTLVPFLAIFAAYFLVNAKNAIPSALASRPGRWALGASAAFVLILFAIWGWELFRDRDLLVAIFSEGGHKLYLPY
jgi:hypothetical protein